MTEHRNDKDVTFDNERTFSYKFSDSEWQLLIYIFEKNRAKFGSVLRNNISKLICSIAASRTITTIQQANIIISLLLYENDFQDQDEQEQICTNLHNAELKTSDNKRLMEINGIIEQIRLLIIQQQALESHRIMCQSLVHDRM